MSKEKNKLWHIHAMEYYYIEQKQIAGVICVSTNKSQKPYLNQKANCRKIQTEWHYLYKVKKSKKEK